MLRVQNLWLVMSVSIAALPALGQEKKTTDWMREWLTDTANWTCTQAGAHLVTGDTVGNETGVSDACVLSVGCIRKNDAQKKVYPVLLSIKALPKKQCPTMQDWIRLELKREDVLGGSPMMTVHTFTSGVKNDGTAELNKFGSKCKFEFAPPFVVWRMYQDKTKQPDPKMPYDRLCTNFVSCEEPIGGKNKLEPLTCAVAKDGNCPSVATCAEKPMALTSVPISGTAVAASAPANAASATASGDGAVTAPPVHSGVAATASKREK